VLLLQEEEELSAPAVIVLTPRLSIALRCCIVSVLTLTLNFTDWHCPVMWLYIIVRLYCYTAIAVAAPHGDMFLALWLAR